MSYASEGEELAAVAYDIIDELGISVTFYSDNSPTYDPSTGEGSDTPDQSTAKITPLEYYADEFVDGEVIQEGDAYLFLPKNNLTFTPEPGLRVKVGTDIWEVVAVDSIYSGNPVALYQLQVRR